jgi:hypothetical protein
MAERKGGALLRRRAALPSRRFESCCFRCSGVVESVRHATVTREAQVRALPPEPRAPVVEGR